MNNLHRRRLALLLMVVLLLVCTFSVAGAAGAQSQAVADGIYSVVRVINIISYDQSTEMISYGSGTGFAVGKGGNSSKYFVTNNHVVEDNPEEVYVTTTDFDGKVPAKVVARWSAPDLAILELEAPLEGVRPVTFASATSVELTQSVYAIGFPGASDEIDDMGDRAPSTPDDATVTHGIISKLKQDYEGSTCLSMSASINHGNSGGPLMTEEGYVVGINTFGYEETYLAVYSDYAVNALESLGIPYQLALGEGRISSNSDLPGAEVFGQGKAGDDTSIILIVLGVAALVGLGVVFLMKKKGGSAKRPTAAAANAAAPPAASARSLVGVAGALAGRTYGVPAAGGLTIGRDPSVCQVVFASSAPGISGRHCSVAPSAKGCTIVDLGSSYGTFLTNGTRLAVNQPYELRVGEAFYIGSKADGFTIQ